MSVRWRLCAALVAVAAVALGCTEPSREYALTQYDSGRRLSVAVGDNLRLTLQTIGPGQFLGPPTVSSAAVRYVGEASPGVIVPAGVRQIYRFQAVAPGSARISLAWADETRTDSSAFALDIVVR